MLLGDDFVSELRAEAVNQVAERRECPGSPDDDVGDGFVSSLHLLVSTCSQGGVGCGWSRQHAEVDPLEEGGEEGRHLME